MIFINLINIIPKNWNLGKCFIKSLSQIIQALSQLFGVIYTNLVPFYPQLYPLLHTPQNHFSPTRSMSIFGFPSLLLETLPEPMCYHIISNPKTFWCKHWRQGGTHTWFWWGPHKTTHEGTHGDKWWSLWFSLESFY